MDDHIEADGRSDFFYPEQTEVRGRAARSGRPPPRPPRRSAVPWLLCALLCTLLAGQWVWREAPLRQQLRRSELGQRLATQAVGQLESKLTALQAACARPAAPLDVGVKPPSQTTATATDDAAWAQRMYSSLGQALEGELAAKRITLQRQADSVLLALPFAFPAAARGSSWTTAPEAEGPWDVAVGAIAKALSADESPYALTIFVPLEVAEAPAPAAGRRRPSRGRRDRHRRQEAAHTPPDAALMAATRATGLLKLAQRRIDLRPKSYLEAAFGAAQGERCGAEATGWVQLRLQRNAP